MSLADEGHHVMLTERIELDVLHDNHLLVVFMEHRRAQNRLGVEVVAIGEEEHGLGDALRALEQSLAFGILAQELEDGLVVLRHLGHALLIVFVYLLVS